MKVYKCREYDTGADWEGKVVLSDDPAYREASYAGRVVAERFAAAEWRKYHAPNQSLIREDIVEAGIDVEVLADGDAEPRIYHVAVVLVEPLFRATERAFDKE